MSALEVRNLDVRYGGVLAVRDVDLDVPLGVIAALIGPNGAGKTSVIDAITGFTPSTGSVRVCGVDITDFGAHRRVSAGVVRTWQNAELFSELTVIQNVQVATEQLGWPTNRRRTHNRHAKRAAWEALEFVGLEARANDRPAEISHGHRKLVGVARALASGADVLLLDEPAAGLDDNESDHLRSHLEVIANQGKAVVLVEHDMRLVFSVCHQIVVLVQGAVVASGTPAAVRQDPAVIAAYLGSSVAGESE